MTDLVPVNSSAAKAVPSTKFIATTLMEEMGFNPIKKMVEQCLRLEEEETKDEALIFRVTSELAKYYTPQIRSVDININQSSTMQVNIMRFDNAPIPIQAHGIEAECTDEECYDTESVESESESEPEYSDA